MPRTRVALIVDDEPDVRSFLEGSLIAQGYRPLSAASGEEALRLLESVVPSVVLTDVDMPGINGLELTRYIKAHPDLQLVPVVILTGIDDLHARVAGLDAGADDFFAKPVDLLELHTRLAALARMKALVDELEQAERIIRALALTIEARDPYTAGHCARLANQAATVGRALGVDAETVRALTVAGYLHDLGKIAVPDSILLKAGPLDEAERAKIRQHPNRGAELVSGLRSLKLVRGIVRHHHERLDGSGYPDGLTGEAIPLGARIMAVVDVYDALVTARPYKVALGPEEAQRILRRETDAGAWDPEIVSVFLKSQLS
jgi:putative two-component system response regulator